MEDKCPNCGAPNNDYLDGFWLCGSIKSMPDDQNGHGTTCLIHQLAARDEEIAALKAEIEVANVQIADISQQFLRQEQRAIKAEAVLGRAKEYNERYFGMLPGYRLRGILDILSDIPAPLHAVNGWTHPDGPIWTWAGEGWGRTQQIAVMDQRQENSMVAEIPVTVVVLPNKQGGEDENTKRNGA